MVDGRVRQSKKFTLDLSELRRLGMDEIALRKGHKEFVVVLVDLDSHQLIDMAPSRKHADIKAVLSQWGEAVLAQIEEVSIDLSGNYRGLVRRLMPEADVVADRFHVMKLVNQDLDRARNAFIRKPTDLPEGVSVEAAKTAMKNSKYALLKPVENLTDTQQEKLAEVKAVSPELAQMHAHKEAFRALFEHSDSAQATLALLYWMKAAQTLYESAVGTMTRWFGEIVQYFEHRTTSGVVEGINNKLKLIKRSGYGFRNFERFRLRCLICWRFPTSDA